MRNGGGGDVSVRRESERGVRTLVPIRLTREQDTRLSTSGHCRKSRQRALDALCYACDPGLDEIPSDEQNKP